ncbi:Uncharacterised protein [Helicobacter fennelliae]|mgnify:CR=1 FL=1|uniref:Uncharacterized protein n=1 Tax=Helicobacter fennelliae TaxID=215 RepID=A0A2X3ENA1_9HELI|nr:hypothetical protein [Helicobacter fennelliae]SQC36497.1 Uncharacterised protein [Helicobacter fennelliae]
MAFKSMKKGNEPKIVDGDKVEEFVSQASGETQELNTGIRQNESVKPAMKTFIVHMEESLHTRLKNYRNTEAKKIETINYIANVAVDAWLKERGF